MMNRRAFLKRLTQLVSLFAISTGIVPREAKAVTTISLEPNTWYFPYVTNTGELFFSSEVLKKPNLYRFGAMRTDENSCVVPFAVSGDWFYWKGVNDG